MITKDSIQLALTLTRPVEPKKTPLIILIHGSGNDSRQNEYYTLLTKEFIELQFAVITYDKRGCEGSSGNWLAVPFSYLKDDVLAIVNTFAADTTFTKIGLWGGSEGSTLAVWAASENQHIDFVIAQSFTAMPFAEQNKYAIATSLKRQANVSQDKIENLLQLQDLLFDFVRTGQGYDKYMAAYNSFNNEEWFEEIWGEPISQNGMWSNWYRTKMDINSTAFLKSLTIPVLFVWGQNDFLIDVQKSMELIKTTNQGPHLQFNIFDDADHSLYAGGRKPVHLKYMKEWLSSVVLVK